MQLCTLATILVVQFLNCYGFWWLFQNQEAEVPTEVARETGTVEKAFAPFEITETETKFLSEASHYLGNLPKLDQCNLLVSMTLL